jgi:uncharacterized protein
MPVDLKRRSRRGLAIFFAVVAVSSACVQFETTRMKDLLGVHFISAYMWSVAAASIVARLILRESPRDVSFRWNGWATTRAMLIAFAFPLVVGITSYGIAWSAGLASFAPGSLPQQVHGIPIGGTTTGRFWSFLLANLTVGSLWSSKPAAGEELGWRGYMLTRLISSGLPAPILCSGLVWALWHLPLIVSGQYPPVARSIPSVAVFITDITAIGYVIAWLRLSSGSIWPCILAHGAWNAVILDAFNGVTRGGGIWVGEAGLLTTSAVILIAIALNRLCPLRLEDLRVQKTDTSGG